MNKISFFLLLLLGLSSCSINKQAQQIKALEKCDYRLVDATQVSLAGTDIRKLMNEQSINLVNLPGLALGYLRKDIPLRATLNLEISNPSSTLAAINNFEYKILVNQQEVATGTVDQRLSIDAGQRIQVPVQVNANVYQFVSNSKVLSDIGDFLSSARKGEEKKGMVTLKIKPSILVGGNLVKYPGFITIDKEVSSKILL